MAINYLFARADVLEKIRERVKKSGITTEQLNQIIEEEAGNVWKKHQSLS
jgi:hypothetical protein